MKFLGLLLVVIGGLGLGLLLPNILGLSFDDSAWAWRAYRTYYTVFGILLTLCIMKI